MPAPKIDSGLIRRYLEEGRGSGHGEDYLAFIQLRRWNASPVSTQTFGAVPPFARPTHFLSRSEWLIALLLSWAGCHVREQIPMWPWRSPHLLHGLNTELDAKLPWSSGTIELCRALDIEHGSFIGTTIPYIWTLDLVATLAWLPPEQTTATVISVKPLESEAYSGDIDPIARGPEKLDVERAFSAALGLPYFVADRTLYPGPILGQIELYASSARLPASHRLLRTRDTFLQRFGDALADEPPLEWCVMLMTESARNLWRRQPLRRWSHEQVEQVLT